MSKMTMTIGCDLSAYATIHLPVGTDLSEKNLKVIAAQIDEDGEWGGHLLWLWLHDGRATGGSFV